jgi:hypothetical protein
MGKRGDYAEHFWLPPTVLQVLPGAQFALLVHAAF